MLQETACPVVTGLVVTFGVCVLIVLTTRWHGRMTFDTLAGPQKFHKTFSPRIGGLAVFTGFWAAASMTASPTCELLFALGASGVFAFTAGLAEDLTKGVSPAWRFLATGLSGFTFCTLTGYSVTSVDVPVLDDVMAIDVVSIGFTVFAIAGLGHAVNIIDGFHGLSSGAVLIMLCAFAVVASMIGDHDLVVITVVIMAAALGFLLVNFPFGHVFLGDSGAYFIGLLLAYVAVMLPARNPDVSPWVSVLVLAYPVLETVFSIARKTARRGHSPIRPDKVHLHMLVYRGFARRIAKALGSKRLANPTAGVLMWGGPLMSLVIVLLMPLTREWLLLALFTQVVVYGLLYRRVALLPRRVLKSRSSISGR